MKKFLIVIVILILLILGLWNISISEKFIVSLLKKPLPSGVCLKADNLKKGLFYNVKIEKLTIKNKNGEILIQNLHAKINPFYLPLGKLKVSFHGYLNQGKFFGKAITSKHKNYVDLTLKDVQLSKFSFLKQMGISGNGLLSGTLFMKDGKGDIKFSVDQANLKNTSFDIPIPLSVFSRIMGYLIFENNTIDVKSFTLEGKNIYAKIKGEIIKNRINVKMEFMPSPSLSSLFLPLEKYRSSPGYYVIPANYTIK